jgi:hypothetical protein
VATYLGLAAAVTIDAAGGFPTTSNFTTNRDIQPGELVVLGISGSGSCATPSSVSVGSLSLSLDQTGTNTFTFIEIWSGYATALIASGSTVSVTMNGSNRDFTLFSFGSILSASWLNAHVNGNQASGGGNDYNLNITTTQPGVIVRGTRVTSNIITSTPNGGLIEINDTTDTTGAFCWNYANAPAGLFTTSTTLSGAPQAEMVAVGYTDQPTVGPGLQVLHSPYRLN